MRIEIDTVNKTVKPLEAISISELASFIDSIALADELDQWKVITSSVSNYIGTGIWNQVGYESATTSPSFRATIRRDGGVSSINVSGNRFYEEAATNTQASSRTGETITG